MFTSQVSCKRRGREDQELNQQEDDLNNHHKAQQLRLLQTGEHVYIPDNSSNGTVIDKVCPCSYNVQTPSGIYI